MHKPPMILLSRSRREANHKASIPKTAAWPVITAKPNMKSPNVATK
jgi:hypothetical protein